jgi:hypothetical protein
MPSRCAVQALPSARPFAPLPRSEFIRGRLDARTAGTSPTAALTKNRSSKWRCRSGRPYPRRGASAGKGSGRWSGTAASYSRLRVHSRRLLFADSTHVLS